MTSKTKVDLNSAKITEIFENLGYTVKSEPQPVTDGEFNTIFSVSTDKGDFMIKLSPNNENHILTYEKEIMKREIGFYKLIAEKTDIPVPRVLHSDFSRKEAPCDWFIMDKIEGKTLDKTDLTPEEKKSFTIEILAKLHEISGEGFGYNGEYADWHEGIYKMVECIYNDGVKKLNEKKNPILKADLKLGRRFMDIINKNEKLLKSVKSTIVNFDLWEKNMIYSPDGKVYLIDPERTFYGDFIGDFNSLNIMGTPLSKLQKEVKEYADKSGRALKIGKEESIRFDIMYAYLCFLMAIEKYYRYSFTDFGFIRNWFMSLLLKNTLKRIESYEK